MVAPVVGAFAETTSDTYSIADLIASVLAADHCSFFNDKPTDAKGMFTQRLYRSFGLATHLDLANLLADRYRDLAELPAQHTRAQMATATSLRTINTHPSMRPTTTLIPIAIRMRTSPIGEHFYFILLEPKPLRGCRQKKVRSSTTIL